MHRVTITDCQSILKIDAGLIEQVVLHGLGVEQLAGAELSIAVVDDAEMHTLNLRHLQHDYPTDVLSFLLDCAPPPSDPLEELPARGCRIEGEIVVSSQTALSEATRFGWDSADELLLYVVHGLLHLCGYDDRTEAARDAMRLRERAVLKNWNLTPNYAVERMAHGLRSHVAHPPSE